jgi:hypothetical protein
MEAICSSETSVDTQRTTRRYVPEADTLYNHRCENLKSYIHLILPYSLDSEMNVFPHFKISEIEARVIFDGV